MARLNGIIHALESGQHAFATFALCDVETAIALQASKYDAVVFEGEQSTRRRRYAYTARSIARSLHHSTHPWPNSS